MEDFGIERTLATPERRTLILAGCAVLVVGVGLGVLIGRLTATPEPAPVSASILPDYAGLPDGNPTIGSSTTGLSPAVEASTPAPAPTVIPSIAVPQTAAPTAPPAIAPSGDAQPVRSAGVVVPEKPQHAEAAERKPKPTIRRTDKPAVRPATRSATKLAEPESRAAASAASGPRWVVQLGAFRSAEHANLLVNTLAVHGQPAEVRFANGWFYVQTPSYRSAHAAKAAAQALAAREHLPTYLIKLPAAAG